MRIFFHPVTHLSGVDLIEPFVEPFAPSISPALTILAMEVAAQTDILDTSYLTAALLTPIIAREAFYPNLAVTAII